MKIFKAMNWTRATVLKEIDADPTEFMGKVREYLDCHIPGQWEIVDSHYKQALMGESWQVWWKNPDGRYEPMSVFVMDIEEKRREFLKLAQISHTKELFDAMKDSFEYNDKNLRGHILDMICEVEQQADDRFLEWLAKEDISEEYKERIKQGGRNENNSNL